MIMMIANAFGLIERLIDLIERLLRRRRAFGCVLLCILLSGCAPIGGDHGDHDHGDIDPPTPERSAVSLAAGQYLADYSIALADAADRLGGQSYDSWESAFGAYGAATRGARESASKALESAINAEHATAFDGEFDLPTWQRIMGDLAAGFRGASK